MTRRGDVIDLKDYNENDVSGIYFSGTVPPYRTEEIIGHWDSDGTFLGGIMIIRALKKVNGSDIICEIKDS